MKYSMTNPDQSIGFGYCHCGCEQKTALAGRANKRRGIIKGQPMSFILGHAGRKRFIPLVARFWTHVAIDSPDKCWPWQAYTHLEYGIFSITHTKRTQAHRMAYELTYGPIPDGKIVCHRCNNKPCCNPIHLYAGTNADNSQDSIRAGTAHRFLQVYGSAHPRSKLTEDKVSQIRQAYSTGKYHVRDLAVQFGVHFATIARICRHDTWTHLP